MLPLPADGKVFPGWAFSREMRSFSDVTGSDGCATTKCGTAAAIPIGVKSLITSYGRFWKSAGAMAFTEMWPIMIV